MGQDSRHKTWAAERFIEMLVQDGSFEEPHKKEIQAPAKAPPRDQKPQPSAPRPPPPSPS